MAELNVLPKIVSLRFWGILIQDSPLLNISGLHGPFTPRIVLRCELSDGAVGWGEVPCNRGVLTVLQQLAPATLGVAAAIPSIDELLREIVVRSKELAPRLGFVDQRGKASFDKGVTNHVRAGIQMAVYDAVARSLGVSLCDLLGGETGRKRDTVQFNLYLFWVANVRGSGLRYTSDGWSNPFAALRDKPVIDIPSAVKLALAAEHHVMPGVKLIKWKCGVLDPQREIELVLALSRAFGPEVGFVPDPNAAWTVETAVQVISTLKRELGPRLPYFEDPVASQEAMAEVHARTGVSLATNMCACSPEEHERAARTRAIQITLAGDPHYTGGSDIAVALSHQCVSLGLDFAQHSNSHLGISRMHTAHMGAAAATHRWPFDTHYDPWQQGRDPLVKTPIVLEHGGTLRIPESPGLGIEIDVDGLMELHQHFLEANSGGRTFTDRDDGPIADWVYGGWTRPASREQKWFMAGVPSAAPTHGEFSV